MFGEKWREQLRKRCRDEASVDGLVNLLKKVLVFDPASRHKFYEIPGSYTPMLTLYISKANRFFVFSLVIFYVFRFICYSCFGSYVFSSYINIPLCAASGISQLQYLTVICTPWVICTVAYSFVEAFLNGLARFFL